MISWAMQLVIGLLFIKKKKKKKGLFLCSGLGDSESSETKVSPLKVRKLAFLEA